MTVKLTVLYGQPEDPAAFDREYFDVHVPLTEQWEQAQRREIARISGDPLGQPSPYYLMFEAWFADQASLQAMFGSQPGRAAAEHFGRIAPPGSLLFVSEVAEQQSGT
jgi:uncharacterized protein (TIGR02118 family)